MPPTEPIIVHKFGGTSVADAERYRAVGRILRGSSASGRDALGRAQWVVVSAMAKVTDALLELATLASRRDPGLDGAREALLARHRATARALLGADLAGRMLAVLARDEQDLADVLRGVWLARKAPESTRELVAGYGELWSAQLLAAHLAESGLDASWLDAREILVVGARDERGPRVDLEESRARLDRYRQARARPLVVVTGFVASDREGAPTTLSRNGSDLSASLFGALLEAEEVVIWTDVPGVLSADPRRVPEAVVLEAMSYDEACELAYFGAKVLHPRTMDPARAHGIPIRIKSSLEPERPGSLIAAPSRLEGLPRHAVTGLSTFDAIALVNLEGSGLVGVPGVAERLFGALRSAGVSVVLISQGSSEHSICFAVPEADVERAEAATRRAFAAELAEGLVQRVDVVRDQTILAAVGDRMARTPGVASTFFTALAKAGVSVRAIAQGSSERNISAVVDRADSSRALRAAHAGFVLGDRVLSLGLVGPGQVGRALLAQLAEQAPILKETLRLELRLTAIADRRRMVLDDVGLAPAEALAALEARSVPLELGAFAEHVRAPHLPHAVIVDATASDAIAAEYERWLALGLDLVTPNKRAGAGPLERYLRLRAFERQGRSWRYEATVGAGLPVITTLRDLVRTGDRVERIEGVLSGTLSYVFNVWDGATPFSRVVLDAKARGFTEPDPRDDLSGLDVARKLVILARELGVELELSDVAIESLVPPALAGVSREAFLDALPAHDDAMRARLEAARATGEVLRYVGTIERSGRARVALERYPRAHALASLSSTDNVIAFTSARYREQPLIVRGPGAGPEVTAAGVFADLLRLVGSFG